MATRAAHDVFRAIWRLKELQDADLSQPWYAKDEEGYYNQVVTYPFEVPSGTVFRFHHYSNDNVKTIDREAMIITTVFGNICVFERFSGGKDHLVVANMPAAVESFVMAQGKVLQEEHIRTLFGIDSDVITDCDVKENNIGKRLDKLMAFGVRNGITRKIALAAPANGNVAIRSK